MDTQGDRKEFFREESALDRELHARDTKIRRRAVDTAGIVLLVLVSIGGPYILLTHIDKAWAGPLGFAVLITVLFYIGGLVSIRACAQRAERSIDRLESITEEHLGEIKDTVTARIRPRVEPLSNTEDLAEEGARYVREVRRDETYRKNGIVYVGSLGLGSRTSLASAEGHGTSGEDNACADYIAEQTLLTKDRIRQERHICLIEPDAFSKRGSRFRHSYLSWTTRQVQLLQDNPEYYLFNRPRAPRWGASTSWMFAGPAGLQIVGDGVAGTLILGDTVVNNVKAAILNYLEDGKSPVRYSSEQLEEYRQELIAAQVADGREAA